MGSHPTTTTAAVDTVQRAWRSQRAAPRPGGPLPPTLRLRMRSDVRAPPAQRRHRRPRRPRQDDPGRRHALADGCLPRQRRRGGAGHGLHRPRTREGDHDPRKEHGGRVGRGEAQHRGHARPRRLRRRGRAGPGHGRRRAPARRRRRGSPPPDSVRRPQGPGRPAADHPRRQQGRPARRSDRRRGRRGPGPADRSRCRRGPARPPRPLRLRPRRVGGCRADDGGQRSRSAVRGPHRARAAAVRRPRRPAAGPGDQPRRRPVPRSTRPVPDPTTARSPRERPSCGAARTAPASPSAWPSCS